MAIGASGSGHQIVSDAGPDAVGSAVAAGKLVGSAIGGSVGVPIISVSSMAVGCADCVVQAASIPRTARNNRKCIYTPMRHHAEGLYTMRVPVKSDMLNGTQPMYGAASNDD
ncbi:MAG: hypothetical protein U0521_14720 [Anaerolineae bacterium]